MSSVCVLCNFKASENSVTQVSKLARFISRHFGIPLVDDFTDKCYEDVILSVSGSLRFCPYREDFKRILIRSKRIFVLQTDYMRRTSILKDVKDIRGRKIFTISNIPEDGDQYINLNQIGFVPDCYSPTDTIEKDYEDTVLYFGTYRPDRKIYFDRYFLSLFYQMVVSARRPQDWDVYRKVRKAESIIFYPVFRSMSIINKFACTLYLEDQYTHSHYNSLATRFYEALSYGVPIIFDESCRKTLKKSEISRWSSFIVHKPEGLRHCLEKRLHIKSLQHDYWYHDYREVLYREFERFLYKQGMI